MRHGGLLYSNCCSMSKGFNRHKQGLEVTGGIPKFLQGLVDEKGKPLQNVNLYARAAASKQANQPAGDELDALLQGGGQSQAEKNSASSTARQERAKKPQSRSEEDVQDELNAIVNLDEFSAEEKQAIMQELGLRRVEDLISIAAVATVNQQQDGNAVAETPAAVDVATKQRDRHSDAAIDAVELETGKHIYRPAKRSAQDVTQTASQQPSTEKRRKSKKSTLSFADDEEDA